MHIKINEVKVDISRELDDPVELIFCTTPILFGSFHFMLPSVIHDFTIETGQHLLDKIDHRVKLEIPIESKYHLNI